MKQQVGQYSAVWLLYTARTVVENSGLLRKYALSQELNQGYFVQRHAMIVSKNIKLLMDGTKDSKLLKYKPSSTTPMVSLGKTDAVVQLSFAMVVGYLPAMWKSRGLFVNRTRTLLGLAR
jgi:hypothetical protein